MTGRLSAVCGSQKNSSVECIGTGCREMITTEILRVTDVSVFRKVVPHIVCLLKDGGVIIFPTDTVYGIGGDALNENVIRKISRIKKRSAHKSFLINVAAKKQIKEYVSCHPRSASVLEKKFLPGALSLVFYASGKLPRLLTGKDGKIGVRIPKHPVTLFLLRAFTHPIVSTSANISGKPAPQTGDALYRLFKGKVNVILDAGQSASRIPSTLVDVTTTPPAILREGAVPKEEIYKALK